MARQNRRSTGPQGNRTVKTSILLDAGVHAKVAAKAALTGVSMNDVMAGAVADAVSSVVCFWRDPKAPKAADSPVQGRESADEAA